MKSALRNKDSRSTPMRDRTDIAFERYRIIVAQVGDSYSGIGYIGTEKVVAIDGETHEAVVAIVRTMLGDRIKSLEANRSSGLPGVMELFEAMIFAGQRDIERLEQILKCHSSFDDGIASFKDIAHRLRIDEASVMTAYLSLARKICQTLSCDPEDHSVPPGLTPVLVVLRPCEGVTGNFVGYALRDAFLEALDLFQKRRPTLKLAAARSR